MKAIIEIKDLIKKFDSVTAVDNISFSVSTGEIFAFLGPNGAGKSTTIKMLTTLLAPTSGSIRLNNHDVLHDQNKARESFGIVFQDPSLDDELTAYENMDFHASLFNVPSSQKKTKIQELLTFVDLWERRNSFVKTFSGGMKRRLEIVRGLLHQPKILFLDEPTLGLDPQTRNNVWEHIRNLNKKNDLTIFFSTHYMEEAEEVADRVAIIDHGKIIAHGTTEQLKKQTKTTTLEKAFLELTGKQIREEEASGNAGMKLQRRMWRR